MSGAVGAVYLTEADIFLPFWDATPPFDRRRLRSLTDTCPAKFQHLCSCFNRGGHIATYAAPVLSATAHLYVGKFSVTYQRME